MNKSVKDWREYAEKLERIIADNTKAYEELKAELSAFKEGIKPEDAKPAVTYYVKYNGNWQIVRTAKGNIYTFDETDRAEVQIYPSHLYPLPHQQKEES
ncbi:MAG: hypothetical protein DHS20C08_04270 [Rhodomicrobium sp.]|nr:MAG: hypothetical protein DHS20C08_04270 [Rhodomicrobium sp.]